MLAVFMNSITSGFSLFCIKYIAVFSAGCTFISSYRIANTRWWSRSHSWNTEPFTAPTPWIDVITSTGVRRSVPKSPVVAQMTLDKLRPIIGAPKPYKNLQNSLPRILSKASTMLLNDLDLVS